MKYDVEKTRVQYLTYTSRFFFSYRLGDKLIVGLNSDASVTKIKRIPFHNQQRRKELLEGFSCVDEVILFDEENPQDLLRRLRPDIYVKGSDYRVEDIFVKGVVGKAMIIQSDLSITTTKIMKECHQRMIEFDCKMSHLPEQYRVMLEAPTQAKLSVKNPSM
jgi:rfaE bifunctional protein nucleotidyltransferase chain/domain